MIKNIVFDMGNVLMIFDPKAIIKKCVEEEEAREMIYQELFASVEWLQMDYGELDTRGVFYFVRKRLPERLHEKTKEIIDTWYNYKKLIGGMEDLAKSLKEKGYKIYLLSNTGMQFHLYKHTIPALKYFDGEFISAEWHLMKPEKEIYRTFCLHFSLVPAECFFIDDMPANIYSARMAGMKGFIFRGDVDKLKLGMSEEGIEV